MKNLFLLSLFLSLSVFIQSTVISNSSEPGICWLNSYGRNPVSPIKWCADNQMTLREDCYDACDAGFTGGDSSDTSEWEQSDPSEDTDVSDYPLITYCWQDCPAGLTDLGKVCANVTAFGNYDNARNQSECEKKYPQGCEFCDSFWYPKSGCGPCARYCPVNCPSNMTQEGEYNCSKQAYNREPASSIQCAAGYELHNRQCYPPAEEGFSCGYFICWQEQCPEGWEKCGAMCLEDAALCTGTLKQVAEGAKAEIDDNAYSSDDEDATVQGIASQVRGIQPYLDYPMCN